MLILIILLLLLVFGLPQWGYWGERQYGYFPSGIVGVILLILLIYFLLGNRF
jgi:hypothetical protein